jgi:hypothetical protein
MAKPNTMDYIEKIRLLEMSVGGRVGYKTLEPFSLNARDAVQLLNAAKMIAAFVGIKQLVLVATTKHQSDVAGHIELGRADGDLYIEVSEDFLDSPESVLATLSHEVCHKYLQINNVSCGSGLESHYHNEVLTDITAVFLGLGKLMLNGSQTQRVKTERIGREERTTTTTKNVGYLDREQFAFVYLFVCAMRRIPQDDYEFNLTRDARSCVRAVDASYRSRFFDIGFHDPSRNEELLENLKAETSEARRLLREIETSVAYLERSFLDEIRQFHCKSADRLDKLLEQSSRMATSPTYDPALRFVASIDFARHVRQQAEGLAVVSREGRRYLKLMSLVKEGLERVYTRGVWGRSPLKEMIQRLIGSRHSRAVTGDK